MLGCSGCLLGGKERSWGAWGAGFYLAGPGRGKLRQDAWVPFLSSPRHSADSSVASVESFRSPSWYFSTRKTRGMLPSPPRLWQPVVTAAVCPGDTAPLQPPHAEVPSPPLTTGPLCLVWAGSDALVAGQLSPMPKCWYQCPFCLCCPPLLRAFASPLGLGLILGGIFFWQFVLLASRNLRGAVVIIRAICSSPEHVIILSAWELQGTPAPLQTWGRAEPWVPQSPASPPGARLMIWPGGCDVLRLSLGILAPWPACPAHREWRCHIEPQLRLPTGYLASRGSPCSEIARNSLGWGRAEQLWGPECDFEDKSQAGPFPGSTHGQALLRLVVLESIQELESSVGYFG